MLCVSESRAARSPSPSPGTGTSSTAVFGVPLSPEVIERICPLLEFLSTENSEYLIMFYVMFETSVHKITKNLKLGLVFMYLVIRKHSKYQQLCKIIINMHITLPGLREEGLFRKSGHIGRQRQLKERLQQGATSTLAPEFTPHDCASVLKTFLAELPEPLLTEKHYQAYCQLPCKPNQQHFYPCLFYMIVYLHEY
jgi:hypothetical protein